MLTASTLFKKSQKLTKVAPASHSPMSFRSHFVGKPALTSLVHCLHHWENSSPTVSPDMKAYKLLMLKQNMFNPADVSNNYLQILFVVVKINTNGKAVCKYFEQMLSL